MGLDLEASDIRLSYPAAGGPPVRVLDLARLRVRPSEAAGITGPSGSGKTSLLYILTGIERPCSGAVRWGGVDLTGLRQGRLDRWRQRNVGFVFQDFHLFPGLSPMANVLLPATFGHFIVPSWMRSRAAELLDRLGVPDRSAPTALLSRGEMQRVALARALLLTPQVVVADEPTASLDADNAEAVGELLVSSCRAIDSTLIVVSHDAALLSRLDSVHRLQQGSLTLRFAETAAR
ncbi:MAG TPA: ATP-binding cassette domain-containing protein [Terriglobales bacterium]|nr:ATP-binding cassette domain-containing protein [Terriglobales bacterium]